MKVCYYTISSYREKLEKKLENCSELGTESKQPFQGVVSKVVYIHYMILVGKFRHALAFGIFFIPH